MVRAGPYRVKEGLPALADADGRAVNLPREQYAKGRLRQV
jgi:hypothetical protein